MDYRTEQYIQNVAQTSEPGKLNLNRKSSYGNLKNIKANLKRLGDQ